MCVFGICVHLYILDLIFMIKIFHNNMGGGSNERSM